MDDGLEVIILHHHLLRIYSLTCSRKPSYRKRMIIGFLTQWGAEFAGPLVIVSVFR